VPYLPPFKQFALFLGRNYIYKYSGESTIGQGWIRYANIRK